MTDRLVFRSRLAQAMAVLTAVVGAVALVSFTSESGVRGLLTTLAPVGLVVALGWAVLWLPRAEIDDDGVTIVNVFRTIVVPWSAFKAAETRWSLTIVSTAGTFSSWGVPAGSGFGARLRPQSQRPDGHSPARTKLESTGTAEAAALAIADRLRQRKKKATGGGATDVSIAVNRQVIGAVAGLAVLTAISAIAG